MTERIGDWMGTYSGKRFWPLDPRPDEVSFFDIANSLAQTNRFLGHSRPTLTVAQHSIMVAESLHDTSLEIQIAGLMHDAHEAYIGDWIKPVGMYVYFHVCGAHYSLDTVKKRIQAAINTKFDLEDSHAAVIGAADWDVLRREARHHMIGSIDWGGQWGQGEYDSFIILDAKDASEAFQYKYLELDLKRRGLW